VASRAIIVYVSDVEILADTRIMTGPNSPEGNSGDFASQNFQVANVNRPVGLGLPSSSQVGHLVRRSLQPSPSSDSLPFAIFGKIGVANKPVDPRVHHRDLHRIFSGSGGGSDIDDKRRLSQNAEVLSIPFHSGNVGNVSQVHRETAIIAQQISGDLDVGSVRFIHFALATLGKFRGTMPAPSLTAII
jgi:hypothetical protein